MTEKRNNAVTRWFIRRFPLCDPPEGSHNRTLEGLKQWCSLSTEDQTDTLQYLDERIGKDEEDLRRKKANKMTHKKNQSSRAT